MVGAIVPLAEVSKAQVLLACDEWPTVLHNDGACQVFNGQPEILRSDNPFL